ncbi:MAG: hypothetical protein WAZ34_16815 [Rhodocyclaceae bacterium]
MGNNHTNAAPNSLPSAGWVETIACRQAAMDRYCQLFARGLFPFMLEERNGTFRVGLSADSAGGPRSA